ncbi:unnamed protein product, partial [Ilex paraguariensis]
LCANETIKIDESTFSVGEATSEDELWAAAYLRVRTFYDFRESFGIKGEVTAAGVIGLPDDGVGGAVEELEVAVG